MLYEKILEEKKRLEDEIYQINHKLQGLPKENLILARNGEKYRKWYCTDGKQRKYIPKQERDGLEKLMYKKYLTTHLKALLSEQKAIEAYLKYHKVDAYQEEQDLLINPEFQTYISNLYKPQKQQFQEWMQASYKKNPYYPEKLIHKTRAGFCVRSKSEVLITMVLSKYHIPFRYECALQLGENCYYPDFTILHPVTGEVFYWEHFGYMDDAKYRQKTFAKLEDYAENGILPTVQLITTYESEKHPLTIELIEEIVKYYFL